MVYILILIVAAFAFRRTIVQIYKINLDAEISEITWKIDIFAFL